MAAPVFKNPVIRWIDHRLPIFSYLHHEAYEYPTPKNLNYWWNFGSLAGFMLVVMIVTGLILAMQYTPHVDYASTRSRHQARRQLGLVLRYPTDGASILRRRLHPHIRDSIRSYIAARDAVRGVLIYMYDGERLMGYVPAGGR